MKPAPPVTRIFLASSLGSNLVLPVNTGACLQRSFVRYDLGFRTVESLRSVFRNQLLKVQYVWMAVAHAALLHIRTPRPARHFAAQKARTSMVAAAGVSKKAVPVVLVRRDVPLTLLALMGVQSGPSTANMITRKTF